MRHYYTDQQIRDAEAPLLGALPDGVLMRRAAWPLAVAIADELRRRTGAVAGRRVLITAGPTYEALDPVRGITNRSSGKQGFAIAAALAELGCEVTLVASNAAQAADFAQTCDVDFALLDVGLIREKSFAIAEGLEEEVVLPGGGKLLVEPVRTLTAIDVNSSGANAEKGMERTALSVNIEAAREIPRQLALRNIGGTIVIDFIDLENRNKREQVLTALREAAEKVLREGESLSSFVEESVRLQVRQRQEQAAFIERGLASRERARKKDAYVSSSNVLKQLEARLAKAGKGRK